MGTAILPQRSRHQPSMCARREFLKCHPIISYPRSMGNSVCLESLFAVETRGLLASHCGLSSNSESNSKPTPHPNLSSRLNPKPYS
eukprot:1368756-Pleurochrysis_carterae.AAC.2